MNQKIVTALIQSQVHPVVVRWVDKIVTISGSSNKPSSKTIRAANNFINTVYAAGLSSSLKVVNIFAPDNLTAAITPLIVVTGSWANSGFVSGDLSTKGLVGNGSTKFLNAGIRPVAVVNTSSAHLSIMFSGSRPANAGVNEMEVGCSDGLPTNAVFWMRPIDVASASYYSCGLNVNYASQSTSTSQSLQGFLCGVNTTGSNPGMYLYYAANDTPHKQVDYNPRFSSSVAQAQALTLFCYNSSGSTTLFSKKTLSFFSMGTSLTQAQSQLLYNAAYTLRQQLGGGNF